MDIQETLVPYLESRTGFYEMLHKMYRWPLTADELAALDAETFRELAEGLPGTLMGCGFNDMYRALRHRNSATRQTLAADFTKVFLGVATYEGFSAQPYASLFTGTSQQLMGTERTAVSKIYRENAVRLSEGIDLPEDHLAFECEFLAIVNQRAVTALSEGDDDRAIELLHLQERFVADHVMNWLPRFYALASRLTDTRFYRGVLRVTRDFLAESVEVIPEIIEEIEAARDGSERAKTATPAA